MIDCGITGSIEVVFTATDDCGNSSETMAVFTVEDTTPPVLTVPDNITIACDDDEAGILEAWENGALLVDVCDNTLTPSFESAFAGTCGEAGVWTYTFSGADECGNAAADEIRTVTIVDAQIPEVLVSPSDIYVECDGTADPGGAIAAWAASFGGMLAVDNCGEPVLSFTAGTPVIQCGTTSVTPYTFTATDPCGNEVSEVAYAHIIDTTVPMITAPSATTVDCASPDPIDWAETAMTTDEGSCSEVTISYALVNEMTTCEASGWTSVYTYMFTAIDECGNEGMPVTSTYTVTDTEAPVFDAAVGLELTCGDDYSASILAWLQSITATDNCNEVTITNDYDGSLPDFCGDAAGITVTFTASDGCLTTDLILNITAADDTTPPSFINCPMDMTVGVDVDECTANVIYSTPAAEDCNGVTVAFTSGIESGMIFPLGATDIVFTATDGCGNEETCEFTITVIDTDDPQILCPSNDVVVCNTEGLCAWESDASIFYTSAIENCPDFTITNNIDGDDVVDLGTVFEKGMTLVSYTIMDANGNPVSSCDFNVVVEDCEAPSFTCPAALVVECDGAGNAGDLAGWLATALAEMDNCPDIVINDPILVNNISGCGGTEGFDYMFSITDCGANTVSCVSTFTIEDTTAPIITDAVDETVECDGTGQSADLLGWLTNNGGATVTTEVCSDVVWTNDYTGPLVIDCGITGAIEVTFTATDACGNAETTSAIFTIEDTTVPVITCPANITLECNYSNNDAIISAWLEDATAIDQCDGSLFVTNDYPNIFAPSCSDAGEYTVTFSTEDDCSNPSSCIRTITIEDTTAPEITCPDDIVLECADANNAADIADWLDDAVATDLCDADVMITNTFDAGFTDGCGDTGEQIVTFTATDACLNASICTSTIIIVDTTPPSIDTPAADETVECDGSGNLAELTAWLASNGGAVASDLCGMVTWANELLIIESGCAATDTRMYRFVATDECGNSISTDASFIIIDTTVPVIDIEAMDIVLECDGSSNAAELLDWLNSNGGAEASDVCGEVTWSNDYGSFDPGACNGDESVTVTFTATDDCGLNSTTTATLTINDTTDPVWEKTPVDLIIECNGSTDPYDQVQHWLDAVGFGEAEDDCSLIIYSNDFTAVETECETAAVGVDVTFRATDACGNFSEEVANIQIIDTYPPIITSPAKDTIVECDGAGNSADLDSWLGNNGAALASDACTDDLMLVWSFTLMNTIDNCGSTTTSTYMFTVEDMCGNVSSASIADFIIEDTTSPSIDTEAMDMEVLCDGAGNLDELDAWLANNAGAIATDICSEPIVWTYNLIEDLDACDLNGSSLYRFTATDDCGNITTTEASFNIIDDEDPVLDCPMGGGEITETYTCDSNFAWDHPMPTDNCGIEEYSYTITDPDGSVNGPFDLASVLSSGTTATIFDFEEGTSTVTYFVSDCSGNAVTCDFMVNVVDELSPYFVNCPLTPYIFANDPDECGAFVNWSIPVARDNCDEIMSDGSIVQVAGPVSGSFLDVNKDPGYTISYEATDNDGNVATCTFTVFIEDVQDPILMSGLPEDITLSCELDVDTFHLLPHHVMDNCTEEPLIDELYVSGMGDDPDSCDYYQYVDTLFWTVTDECMNAMTWKQVISHIDTTAPTIVLPPDFTVDECMSIEPDPDITGVPDIFDNCAPFENLEISFMDMFIEECSKDTAGVIFRTWKATDPCGNMSTAVQAITLLDDAPPEINCLDTVVVDLGTDIVYYPNEADLLDTWSDCFPNIDFSFSPPKLDCGDLGENPVIVTASDPCGNTNYCQVIVILEDTTAPVLDCSTPDITIDLSLSECELLFEDLPIASVDCDVQITTDPPIFDNLGEGTHTINVVATDASGNQSSCDINVTINNPDFDFGSYMVCNNHINVSLDQWCQFVLEPDHILEGNENFCPEFLCIEIEDESGLPHDNFFDETDVNQTFNVSIIDCNGSGNSCWGTMLIEEKQLPEIECPDDVTIFCSQDPDATYNNVNSPEFGQLITGEVTVLNCEPNVIIDYEDVFEDFGQCSTPRGRYIRTWYVQDDEGNEVSCEQIITILPCDLDYVVAPPDYGFDNPFECYEVWENPEIVDPEALGYPTLGGVRIDSLGYLCDVSYAYSDEIFWLCGGSYEIIRTWKVRDMCEDYVPFENPREFYQIIKVLDLTAPALHPCPNDITISTNPWDCQAELVLPSLGDITDHCSNFEFEIYSLFGELSDIEDEAGEPAYLLSGLEKGVTTVRYFITDECGNRTICEFDITIVDDAPPTPIAKEDIVIALTGGGSSNVNDANGVAKLFANTVDNGSHDGDCGPVRFEIRRVDDSDACGNLGLNDYNNNITFNNNGNTDDNLNDTDNGNYVKFCCADLDQVDEIGSQFGIHAVILRVWDNGSDMIPNTPDDNYNETWTNIRVESKLRPTITCPPDVTVCCGWDPEDLDKTGFASALGVCDNFEVAIKRDTPLSFDDVCNEGTIRRTWDIVLSRDESTGEVTSWYDIECDQLITVEWESCWNPNWAGGPFDDGTYQPIGCVNPDEPYCADRISWPDNETIDCADYELELPTWPNETCDLIGWNLESDTFMFEDGACMKILHHWTLINWCVQDRFGDDPRIAGADGIFGTNDDIEVGTYRHTQELKFYDSEKPEIAAEDICIAVDNTCNGFAELTAVACDTLSDCMSDWIKWEVMVDVWGDWTVDYEFSSFVSAFDPNFGTPINELYIAPTASCEALTITLPEEIEGSKYEHRVVWKATDGCGNVTSATTFFTIEDKKAPIPYCLNVSTAIMELPYGDVTLWACDFELGSSDNCTEETFLRWSFGPAGLDDPIESNPRYDSNSRCTSKRFTCDDLAMSENGVIDVDVYVWDECDNYDFCTIQLTLQDNNEACDNVVEGSARIGGNVQTDYGMMVENVQVFLEAELPEFPISNMTNETGNYMFTQNAIGVDYMIKPSKNDDVDNGITTLDIVLIQRHILGIEDLESAYQKIAADVNHSETITAADLVDIRRVILGMTNEFPDNTSWRFAVQGEEVDYTNPFIFDEKVYVSNLSDHELFNDFVGIKIGDINGSAVNPSDESESRNNKEIKLTASKVGNGRLAIRATEDLQLSGIQLHLAISGGNITHLEDGALEGIHSFVSNGAIRFTWSNAIAQNVQKGEILCYLGTNELEDHAIIQSVDVILNSEGYNENLERFNISIEFDQPKITVYQNEPNPFIDETLIKVLSDKNRQVQFEVLDANNRLILNRTYELFRGGNIISLNRDLILTSGVYYYRFSDGEWNDTKKMIILD